MESILADILFVLNGRVMITKLTNRWNLEFNMGSKALWELGNLQIHQDLQQVS
jgi:predicted transcriptional regulator